MPSQCLIRDWRLNERAMLRVDMGAMGGKDGRVMGVEE